MKYVIYLLLSVCIFTSCTSESDHLKEFQSILRELDEQDDSERVVVEDKMEAVSPAEEVTEQVMAVVDSAIIPINYAHYQNDAIDLCYWSEDLMELMIEDTSDNEFIAFQLLTDEQFAGLTTEEKFIYSIKFPEEFDQICAEMEPRKEDYLYGEINLDFSGETYSERQYKFLYENPSQTIALVMSCIQNQEAIAVPYRHLLKDLEAVQAMPIIIEVYKKTKDSDYLSLLLEIMRKKKVATLGTQLWYEQLYVQQNSWEARIPLTEEIANEIIALAKDYSSK